jgi:quercetin dioxygenase-like cupin family protein
MILKGIKDPENAFRISFDIDTPNAIKIHHFAVRTTTPSNPFTPHKHKQEELWYIIEGQGVYSEDDIDHPVEAGDLIQIKPWILHGLHSDTKIVWICLG